MQWWKKQESPCFSCGECQTVFRKYILTLTPMFLYHIGVFKKRGEIMDESKLTPEELEEMEKQFWEIVRKYRPEIFEENESDTDYSNPINYCT
ncbi:hypothetical protein, partial [Fusicatenibacter saccharivorans]|uniref:hypothetical protein n=1 Tax=Fusicatenibacter saccharivorans TaxID=1150298 RepID=UPI001A9BA349